jgi:hypothetical protein
VSEPDDLPEGGEPARQATWREDTDGTRWGRVAIRPGTVHVVRFEPSAIESIRSLNYHGVGGILLHVVVRRDAGLVVINSQRDEGWGAEVRLELTPSELDGPIDLRLGFVEAGVALTLRDGRSILFDRWSGGAGPVEVAAPEGIFLHGAEGAPWAGPPPEDFPAADLPAAVASRDPVEAWLAAAAAGLRMAEIGALLAGEASLIPAALRLGAAEATAIDLLPRADAAWSAFEQRVVESVGRRDGLRLLSAALPDSDFAEQVGPFDIVACRGLLDRLPDPVGALLRLRQVTRGVCLLAVATVPELIENPAGTLDLRAQGALLVPLAAPDARAVLAEHLSDEPWLSTGMPEPGGPGWVVGTDIHVGARWWAMTAPFIDRLVAEAGFRCREVLSDAGDGMRQMLLEPA